MRIVLCRRSSVTGIVVFMAALAWSAIAQEPAANLVKNGDAESGAMDNWTPFTKVVSERAHSGNHCFHQKGYNIRLSKELIPIDPSKTYVLSGWFKSVGQAESHLYFGCAPFDADKQPIASHTVSVIPKTETALAEPCRKGDKIIRIRDGAKWQPSPHMYVAFEIDDSGEFADLPNRKMTAKGITKAEKEGGAWAVHLQLPCRRSYPAGTKVREHRGGSTYIYNVAGRKPVPMEWTEFKGRTKGESKHGLTTRQWWHGTRYVQILIMANFQQPKEFELLIDDVAMTEAAQ